MIDQPKPVEDAVVDLIQGGVFDEADELIFKFDLDLVEMYARAGKLNIKGETHE